MGSVIEVKKKKKRVLKPGKKKVPPKHQSVKIISKASIKKAAIEAGKAAEEVEFVPVDTEKATSFGSSIAEMMKRRARAAEEADKAAMPAIKLSKRPTSRDKNSATDKFSDSDLKDFKKKLLAEREKIMNGAESMRATGFNESDDHEADGGDGTNQTLRLQALGQMGTMNRTIQQIEEALHRIEDGSYGVCTSCGQLIRKPRLMNQPFVLTCMECQSEMEKNK